jgi:molecular chaperone HtpG
LSHPENFIGVQLLDIVTTGMYSDPRMVLREYIQNAADSIEKAIQDGVLESGAARIEINTDPEKRTITIYDNGLGMSSREASRILGALALSTKKNTERRGFRGIGRLGGIGYSDKLVFETRYAQDNEIVEVIWDSLKFRGKTHLATALSDVLQECTAMKVSKAPPKGQRHFFKVTLYNVHRFGGDVLFDEADLFHYLAQVAPVPYDEDIFTFAKEIQQHIEAIEGTRPLRVIFNGKEVKKRYANKLNIRGSKFDTITKVNLFELHGLRNEVLAKGWYAESAFFASLASDSGVCGIRLRQGNIGIGDSQSLARFFSESRFAAWHVGEIHFSYELKLNARRDDFELSKELESCYEQLGQLGAHLSYLIRNASKLRAEYSGAKTAIADVRSILNCASYLTNIGRKAVMEELLMDGKTSKALALMEGSNEVESILRQIEILKTQKHDVMRLIDGRCLRHKNSSEVIEHAIRTIENTKLDLECKAELIKSIIKPYTK